MKQYANVVQILLMNFIRKFLRNWSPSIELWLPGSKTGLYNSDVDKYSPLLLSPVTRALPVFNDVVVDMLATECHAYDEILYNSLFDKDFSPSR